MSASGLGLSPPHHITNFNFNFDFDSIITITITRQNASIVSTYSLIHSLTRPQAATPADSAH
jgi:hypothetical protein